MQDSERAVDALEDTGWEIPYTDNQDWDRFFGSEAQVTVHEVWLDPLEGSHWVGNTYKLRADVVVSLKVTWSGGQVGEVVFRHPGEEFPVPREVLA